MRCWKNVFYSQPLYVQGRNKRTYITPHGCTIAEIIRPYDGIYCGDETLNSDPDSKHYDANIP